MSILKRLSVRFASMVGAGALALVGAPALHAQSVPTAASTDVAARAVAAQVASQAPIGTLPKPKKRLVNPLTGTHAFMSGLNIGYLQEHYAFDLGPNLAGVRGLYQYYGNGLYQSESAPVFAGLLGRPKGLGGNITRVFVFANAQGLTFDYLGAVNGVDKTFIKNLENELEQFRKNGLSAILVLTTPNDDFTININPDPNTPAPLFGGTVATPIYVGGVATGATVADYYNNPTARAALVKNGFGTLSARLHKDGYDDAVFAYEIVNEYNQAVDHGNFSQATVQSLIDESRKAIKANYRGYVTASTINYYAFGGGYISNLKVGSIDFLDLHEYVNDGVIPVIDPKGPPVILGEANCNEYDPNCHASDDQAEAGLIETFALNAVKNGYSGFLPWWLGSSQQRYDPQAFIVRDGAPVTGLHLRPSYYVLQQFDAYLNQQGDLR